MLPAALNEALFGPYFGLGAAWLGVVLGSRIALKLLRLDGHVRLLVASRAECPAGIFRKASGTICKPEYLLVGFPCSH